MSYESMQTCGYISLISTPEIACTHIRAYVHFVQDFFLIFQWEVAHTLIWFLRSIFNMQKLQLVQRSRRQLQLHSLLAYTPSNINHRLLHSQCKSPNNYSLIFVFIQFYTYARTFILNHKLVNSYTSLFSAACEFVQYAFHLLLQRKCVMKRSNYSKEYRNFRKCTQKSFLLFWFIKIHLQKTPPTQNHSNPTYNLFQLSQKQHWTR